MEISFFQVVTWFHVGHVIKGSCGFKDGSISVYVTTLLSLLSIALSAGRKNNGFSLSRDLAWPLHGEIKRIHGWVLIVLCHHPDKSCDHKHCEIGDVMSWICRVTFREHTFKGLCEFMGRIPLGESPLSHVWWPLL